MTRRFSSSNAGYCKKKVTKSGAKSPEKPSAANVNRAYSLPVQIARMAIEKYVKQGVRVSAADVPLFNKESDVRSGTFVSIRKNGKLRGCIGTSRPLKNTLSEEIICNAISSATKDPRFPPVAPDELADLDITVDVLTRSETVLSRDELDPAKYGLIVSSGVRRGLLLPAIDGVESVEEQINICRMKAGIGASEDITIQRFEINRYI